MTQILFYEPKQPYYEFSNFYGCKENNQFLLIIDDQYWLSTEHYYQSSKFRGPLATQDSLEYAELVGTADTPNKALILANQKKKGGYAAKWKHSKSENKTLNELIDQFKKKGVSLRADWDQVKDTIMLKANICKYSQNKKLADLLIQTKGNQIFEHTKRDSYWGTVVMVQD